MEDIIDNNLKFRFLFLLPLRAIISILSGIQLQIFTFQEFNNLTFAYHIVSHLPSYLFQELESMSLRVRPLVNKIW